MWHKIKWHLWNKWCWRFRRWRHIRTHKSFGQQLIDKGLVPKESIWSDHEYEIHQQAWTAEHDPNYTCNPDSWNCHPSCWREDQERDNLMFLMSQCQVITYNCGPMTEEQEQQFLENLRVLEAIENVAWDDDEVDKE